MGVAGHAPQSVEQLLQFSPAPHVPLPQVAGGGSVGAGVSPGARVGAGVGHAPQSEEQLAQDSPAPQPPLPHPAGVGAGEDVGAGVGVGLPLQQEVQQALSLQLPIVIPPLTIAHSPAGAGQFWWPPQLPPEQSDNLGQSHVVDEHP